MLSRILALPFVLGVGVFLYLAWEVDTRWAIYMVPFVLILVAIYVFEPQIDWWWVQRNPIDLDPPLIDLLEKGFPYYAGLSDENKIRFRKRMSLYMAAITWIPKGPETVPEDIKGVLAANVTQLMFGHEDYRLSQFERIVIYPKVFISPQHQQHIHASETHVEDKVLLFGAEKLMHSSLQSHLYYNLGLHEYAKVYLVSHPDNDYPKLDDNIWPDLEKICGFTKKKIVEFIGLPDLDPLQVSITLFFCFPEKFAVQLPDVFNSLSKIFNQDPRNKTSPVIDESNSNSI